MQNADPHLFFIDFMKALIDSLERQVSVQSFRSQSLGIDIEFEVHVSKVGGRRLGRVTEAQANRINANRSTKQ